MEEIKIEQFIGKTFISVTKEGGDSIVFRETQDTGFSMVHDQDCCEGVYIEDINGDLNDLVGTPILTAEETTNSKDPMGKENLDSFTWTFYKFSTIKGYVTIRWLGESNGYYSESVDIHEL